MKRVCKTCGESRLDDVLLADGTCVRCLQRVAESSAFPDEAIVLKLLRGMTPAQRKLVFDEFCAHCGSDDPRCRCWDDE